MGTVSELTGRRSIVNRKLAGGALGATNGAANHCASVEGLRNQSSNSLSVVLYRNCRFSGG